MEIEPVAIPGGIALRLTGRLDTASAPRVEPVLLAAVPKGGVLVLDLARLRYCSSAGLRLLLKLLREVEARQARFALAAVQPAVQEVLESTGFDRLMRQFPSMEAAAAGLR